MKIQSYITIYGDQRNFVIRNKIKITGIRKFRFREN